MPSCGTLPRGYWTSEACNAGKKGNAYAKNGFGVAATF
jgi:hypothetical protein